MKTFLTLLTMMGAMSSTAAFANTKPCFISDAVAEEPAELKGDAAYYWFFKPYALPTELSETGPTTITTALFRVQLALNKDDHSLTYVFEEPDKSAPGHYIAQPAQVISDVDSMEEAEMLPIHSTPVEIGGVRFRAEFGCR
jgi:hypothetical protein